VTTQLQHAGTIPTTIPLQLLPISTYTQCFNLDGPHRIFQGSGKPWDTRRGVGANHL